MNQDTQRSFIVKLLAASLFGAVAWHMLVGSRLQKEQDIHQERIAQVQAIALGEQAIEQHEETVTQSIKEMSRVRDELITQLGINETSSVHKNLQAAAEIHNLTVSRIEPLSKRVSEQANKQNDKLKIKLETSEFRVECTGSFAGIVGFIQELSTGSNISTVNSFRVIPVSSYSARMILQVSMYQLIEVPSAFTSSLHEEAVHVTSAGGADDE